MPETNIPSNPTSGQFVGRYRIVRELARSNDIVYEAFDPTMNRKVALKQLNMPGHLNGQEKLERIERFKREAKAAGTLNHRNIVTIYEIGQDKSIFFIAMEFLVGQSLRSYMTANGPLPVRLSMQIALEMCDALGYAHSQKIIHRDVKPDNVHLIPPDHTVKLTDFGIARVLEEPSLTATGQVFGTPSYMSPEQLCARNVDHRTDLFSLGVMLYELLTGRKPFHGDNIVAVTYQIMNAPVTFPNGMPAGITTILRRALAKDPDLRYPNAAAMAVDIRSELVLHDSPRVVSHPVSVPAESQSVADSSSLRSKPTKPLIKPEAKTPSPLLLDSDATLLADPLGLPPSVGAATPPPIVPAATDIAQEASPAPETEEKVKATPLEQRRPPTPPPDQTPFIMKTVQPGDARSLQSNNVLILGGSIAAILIVLGLMILAIGMAYKTSVKTNERVLAVNYYDKAVTASIANRPTEAISNYNKAMSLAGENSDIVVESKRGLGQAYTAEGDSQAAANDISDAVLSYQSAIRNDPTNVLAHFGLAQVSDGSTRLSELEMAIRYDPTGRVAPDARAEAAAEYAKQADAAFASGDKDTARSSWMRVIDLVPGDPLATQAHQRLDSAGL